MSLAACVLFRWNYDAPANGNPEKRDSYRHKKGKHQCMCKLFLFIHQRWHRILSVARNHLPEFGHFPLVPVVFTRVASYLLPHFEVLCTCTAVRCKCMGRPLPTAANACLRSFPLAGTAWNGLKAAERRGCPVMEIKANHNHLRVP